MKHNLNPISMAQLILARARLIFVTVVAISSLAIAGLTPAQAQLSKGKGSLRVMTYNIAQGTNLRELATAQSQEAFLVAVGQTITKVRATNPPKRMEALAKQILAGRAATRQPTGGGGMVTGPFNPTTGSCSVTQSSTCSSYS